MARDQAYRKAELKIEQARRSGTMKLDLSNMGLKKLPPEIGGLKNLTELYLGNHGGERNQLTELTDEIGKLKHLKKLDAFDIELTVLPESIGKLTRLKELNLAFNHLMILPESISQLEELQSLELQTNRLATLPESIGRLAQLQKLDLRDNQLSELPESLGNLIQLTWFAINGNKLIELPKSLGNLTKIETLWIGWEYEGVLLHEFPQELKSMKKLRDLNLDSCNIRRLPNWIGEFTQLRVLYLRNNNIFDIPASFGHIEYLMFLVLSNNQIKEIPSSISQCEHLQMLRLDDNPINPELVKALEQGRDAIRAYLRAKAETGQTILNEGKLILIGEGEVGKSCLLGALRGDSFVEGLSTTHGIEVKPVKVLDPTDPESQTEFTLNAWDFGGQRVYRPTHQLFFSAPAVYLVVWKPREGSQAGQVKEWIQLVKRREPSAKILVVATHGGPQQRQPDIDRQELWDLFGRETVVGFFFVESKPDAQAQRKGIDELKRAIAQVAASLPEVGRSVPKSFADVRVALQETGKAYLPLRDVLDICRAHNMDDEIARLFITISHRLGHLTHYENDPTLRDIVILRPDWLATAMSYVLDDEETRAKHGLVNSSRLSHLWDDPTRADDSRYEATLHPIFLRLMERFDLSYRVAGLSKDEDSNPVSLIAQLVPDTTPKEDDFTKAWSPEPATGDIQQTQICRIVDAANGQSANAEGLFFQLIVRLHKYSLGRVNYNDSVHWQRGLILDANYNGRALLRHIGNDVHITVRAAFPERFLGMVTEEVKYLVESFWEGLRCDVTVPCITTPNCKGLFEVNKLIDNKKRGRPEMPCPVCNEWQNIGQLLANAPAGTEAISLDALMKEFAQVKDKLDVVNDNTKRILSQVDKQYADLIQIFTDDAKEGPRLYSLFPLDENKFDPRNWIRHQFRLVLWCEHSRLPLPVLNDGNMKKGVYDIQLDRDWFNTAAPYLKVLAGTLSLVLPVASSTLKVINDAGYKSLINQIDHGKSVIDAMIGDAKIYSEFIGEADSTKLKQGSFTRAENSNLRYLHFLLKEKDPGFGGLVRVMNKRQEFLWVHEKFASEY